MSYVSYSTQIGPYPNPTQPTQSIPKVFLVYNDDSMNQYQTNLMKEAQYHLIQNLDIGILSKDEIKDLTKDTKYFVIPCSSDTKLVSTIKNHIHKPVIYTARCVVEARKYRQMTIPSRSLAISLSMVDCQIFLTRSCNTEENQRQINEMCGTVLGDFNNPKLNVVVTKRADDKYCAKARSRKVAVVSEDWIKDTYQMSRSTEDHMNHDAMSQLTTYQIRPFLGLTFKITLPQLGKELRDLINNNGGSLAFGQTEGITHVVSKYYPDDERSDNHVPRVVDVEFLRACDRVGYYMSKKCYREYRAESMVAVKQERLSPNPSSMQENGMFGSHDCFTPPQQNPQSTLSSIKSNGCDRMNENQSMPPPLPSMARQARQQGDNMDAIIRRALSSFENSTQQTQLVSTQIRRLPETEIRFERTAESSQQLYWSDSVSRRH